MSDNEQQKSPRSGSEDSADDLSHSGEEGDHPDVKWDPSKKPKKGILRKEGEHHEKKEGHIALNADGEHDAEKKPTNKNLPVEGVQGIVKKGEKKPLVKKGDNKEHQMLRPRNQPKDGAPAAGASSPPTQPKKDDDADKKKDTVEVKDGSGKVELTENDLAGMDEKEKEKCIIS
jgi:hypothetical protein